MPFIYSVYIFPNCYRYGWIVGGARISRRMDQKVSLIFRVLRRPPKARPEISPVLVSGAVPPSGYARRRALHGTPAKKGMEDMKIVRQRSSAWECSA